VIPDDGDLPLVEEAEQLDLQCERRCRLVLREIGGAWLVRERLPLRLADILSRDFASPCSTCCRFNRRRDIHRQFLGPLHRLPNARYLQLACRDLSRRLTPLPRAFECLLNVN